MSVIMTACALGKTLQFNGIPTDPLIPEGYGAFDIGGEVIVIQDYRLAYPAYVLTYTLQRVHKELTVIPLQWAAHFELGATVPRLEVGDGGAAWGLF